MKTRDLQLERADVQALSDIGLFSHTSIVYLSTYLDRSIARGTLIGSAENSRQNHLPFSIKHSTQLDCRNGPLLRKSTWVPERQVLVLGRCMWIVRVAAGLSKNMYWPQKSSNNDPSSRAYNYVQRLIRSILLHT